MPISSSSPKLMDRVREALRLRHYSRRTEEAYTAWIRRYILFHKKKHPGAMGAADVSAFLVDLAVRQHVSASTQNQALSALLFLYREVLRTSLPRIGVARGGRCRSGCPLFSRATRFGQYSASSMAPCD